jgi:hypothetical protein
MFGHLQPEDFMSMIDGGTVSQKHRAHLTACAACRATQESIQGVHHDLAMTDADDIPEPEWTHFRESVRLQLLSRSVQRESAIQRWTGWPIRPAFAWGISFIFLVCVSTGGFLWHKSMDAVSEPQIIETVTSAPDPNTDAELSAWTNTGVFEELSRLEGAQAERVRQLLQSAQKGTLNVQ